MTERAQVATSVAASANPRTAFSRPTLWWKLIFTAIAQPVKPIVDCFFRKKGGGRPCCATGFGTGEGEGQFNVAR